MNFTSVFDEKKSWIWMKDYNINGREKEFVGMSSEFFHSLHYFKPFLTNVLIFYTPWKHQKTFGFLVFFQGVWNKNFGYKWIKININTFKSIFTSLYIITCTMHKNSSRTSFTDFELWCAGVWTPAFHCTLSHPHFIFTEVIQLHLFLHNQPNCHIMICWNWIWSSCDVYQIK